MSMCQTCPHVVRRRPQAATAVPPNTQDSLPAWDVRLFFLKRGHKLSGSLKRGRLNYAI